MGVIFFYILLHYHTETVPGYIAVNLCTEPQHSNPLLAVATPHVAQPPARYIKSKVRPTDKGLNETKITSEHHPHSQRYNIQVYIYLRTQGIVIRSCLQNNPCSYLTTPTLPETPVTIKSDRLLCTTRVYDFANNILVHWVLTPSAVSVLSRPLIGLEVLIRYTHKYVYSYIVIKFVLAKTN